MLGVRRIRRFRDGDHSCLDRKRLWCEWPGGGENTHRSRKTGYPGRGLGVFDEIFKGGQSGTGNGNTGFANTGNDNAALLAALHATDFLGQNDAALKVLAGDNGPLKLDNSSSFAGTVAGMTGQDTLDLADKDPGKVQPRSFSGNSLGGMLTVTEGMHTPNVALLGNYMASVFVAQSDGHGGTTITDPVIAAQNQITLPHA
jgi:hypothetical protein